MQEQVYLNQPYQQFEILRYKKEFSTIYNFHNRHRCFETYKYSTPPRENATFFYERKGFQFFHVLLQEVVEFVNIIWNVMMNAGSHPKTFG